MQQPHALVRRTATALLALLATGATLLCAQDYNNRRYQEIEPEKPFYLARKHEAWQARSRVVGVVRNPPAQFVIEFINPATLQAVRTETHAGALTVYESGWLAIGTYDIVVKAEGFLDQRIAGVKLKPASDCVLNLLFNPTLYKRR